MHTAHLFFSLPCGHPLHSTQLHFSLPCEHRFPSLMAYHRIPLHDDHVYDSHFITNPPPWEVWPQPKRIWGEKFKK